MKKQPPLPLREAILNEYVQELSAPAFGAYIRLLAAALWRKTDITKLSDGAVLALARIHLASWKHVKKSVNKALAETLDDLKAIYAEREVKLAAMQRHAHAIRKHGKRTAQPAPEFIPEAVHAQAGLVQGYYPPPSISRGYLKNATARREALLVEAR